MHDFLSDMPLLTETEAPFYKASLLHFKEINSPDPSQAVMFALGSDTLLTHCYMPGKMHKANFIASRKDAVRLADKPLAENTVYATPFVGILPFFIFAFIVVSKALYPRRFFQLISASFSNQAQWQLLREWYPLNNGLTYLYTTLYFVGYTLLINAIASQGGGAGISITGLWWLDLLLLFLGVSLIISGKYFTIMFLAVIFNAKDSGERYLTNQITFGLISVLVLIPVLLAMYFQASELSMIAGIVIIGLVQLFRMIRSWRVGLTEKAFGLHYLFLYLCALEIIPLLIVIKTYQIFAAGGVIG